MDQLSEALAHARMRARYSQDDVGAALGISRTMVSYWEAGRRKPNDRQLMALAHLYGMEFAELVRGGEAEARDSDLAGMLLRAEGGIDPGSVPGIREFASFLDLYAELSEITGIQLHGLSQSPFVHRTPFDQKDDARRKAEEVRSHLGLGTGPIPDIDTVCEMMGIAVYRAPLGGDLSKAPSGAFFDHPDVGFSVLVNLDMTIGRRRFTVAHEIAHALFHSAEGRWVVSQRRNSRETFADEFAGEFLMPSEGVRGFMEEAGMNPRLTDPVDTVHIQRYFRASFPMTLVRLRQMNAINQGTYARLRDQVRPVALARSLGYPIDPEEYEQNAELWRIRRFPRAFLRMLRAAIMLKKMSPPSAASFAGLSIPDLVHVLGQPTNGDEPEGGAAEFAEFEASGVV